MVTSVSPTTICGLGEGLHPLPNCRDHRSAVCVVEAGVAAAVTALLFASARKLGHAASSASAGGQANAGAISRHHAAIRAYANRRGLLGRAALFARHVTWLHTR